MTSWRNVLQNRFKLIFLKSDIIIINQDEGRIFISSLYEEIYTEHCSVGPTKLIETTIASTTRMTVYADDKNGWKSLWISKFRFLNLDF